jgi:hypothetical protein
MRLATLGGLNKLGTGAALVALAAVLAVRAGGLLRDAEAPTAQGERRWMRWAWRGPEVGERLARTGELLAPGRPVVLVIAWPHSPRAGWWRYMASYHFSRNPVVAVRIRDRLLAPGGGLELLGKPPASTRRAQRVQIRADGEVEVLRRGPGG